MSMGQKYPFDYSYSMNAAAGSNDLAGVITHSGQLVCIQRVAVENETSGADDVRLLKAGTGGELLLAEEDAVQVDTLYWIEQPIYLHEGQYLVARFTGCTAADILKMYQTGWYQERGEEG